MQNVTIVIVSVIIGLLILASVTRLISKYSKIPFTILLVLVGMGLASLGTKEQSVVNQLAGFNIYSDILLFVCLPTLIFEAAFTMDARLLRATLVPVLTLSIPGLFVSTAIIGFIVSWLTPLSFLTSLLLGAILSSTDSVTVVGILRQLGIPKRLAILVEGESLLNSSTAFVLVKTILFVMLAASISTQNIIMESVTQFCLNFFGGIIVGLLTTLLIGFLISLMEDDNLVVTSLTIILAYLSFIAAEALQVSGVMATITSALIMADWGRTRVSAQNEKNIRNLLSFLAYIVNSLIFILVGFSVNLSLLLSSLLILVIAIVAMLLARAAMIFGLIPLVSRLPNAHPINMRYQTIMWWGGIQGAIGLTIVLGIPDLPEQELLTSIVMGAVLFTIIVQGSFMSKLIHKLRLDRTPISDKFATIEAEISAENMTLARIPELQRSGLFSLKIAENLLYTCQHAIERNRFKLVKLKQSKLNSNKERKLLFLTCFSKEKYFYYDTFGKGHIGEQAYRILNHDVDMKIDSMRYSGRISEKLPTTLLNYLLLRITNVLSYFPNLSRLANWLRVYQSIIDYEVKWTIHQACWVVLNDLDEKAKTEAFEIKVIAEAKAVFQEWFSSTEDFLNEVAEQFPEFVNDMQQRFAKRLLLNSKYEAILYQVHQGLLPQGIADKIITKYRNEIRQLSKEHPEKLKLEPRDLLRKVPFFREIKENEFDEIIPLLKEYHAPPGEIIIKQGTKDDSMYLIMRGVVRVLKEAEGASRDIATLIAGDFFGELALLHHIQRTATCKTITPCILFILKREDFSILVKKFPGIQRAVAEESAKRIALPESDTEIGS